MKDILTDRDSFDKFLDSLICYDIPKALTLPNDKQYLITLIFSDVVILGELRALHKLIAMAESENRNAIFEAERDNDVFYSIFTNVIKAVQIEVIHKISERLIESKMMGTIPETKKVVLH